MWTQSSVRRHARQALERVRAAWWPTVLASVAAALAWLIAHRVLGHPQPFFAPIAATISLSTSWIQRSRRIAQMVIGVLLGIGIGQVLASTLGTSTLALGVIVFVTLIAALLAGVGFIGEGLMFVNQAAASAILVVTLNRHGTGGERVVDALVGGGVALVLGVLLFPAEPMSMLRNAERAMLRTLADTLSRVAERIAANVRPDDTWALRQGSAIHRQLSAMARAQDTAHANVRVAPRRWHLRASVDSESRRMMRLELLANAVLGLVRTAATDIHGTDPIASDVQQQVGSLAEAIARLAATPQPWPDQLRREVNTLAGAARPDLPVERDALAAAILRAAARDLAHVTGTQRTE